MKTDSKNDYNNLKDLPVKACMAALLLAFAVTSTTTRVVAIASMPLSVTEVVYSLTATGI